MKKRNRYRRIGLRNSVIDGKNVLVDSSMEQVDYCFLCISHGSPSIVC